MSKDIFNIRYVKLHFTLEILEDCILPVSKASALRGGMGEMLLRACCIRDRKCESCDFARECIVQRIMYTPYEIRPNFATKGGDSAGYVLACENYQEHFQAGECLEFQMILFGKAIVYFSQILQAFYALGQYGLGKENARYRMAKITNTRDEPILVGDDVRMDRYVVEYLGEYIDFRMKKIQREGLHNIIVFRSPWSQKAEGKLLEEFRMDVMVRSAQRRIYLLDCLEGIDGKEEYYAPLPSPAITAQKVRPIKVMRYSFRQDQKVTLWGIKGEMRLDGMPEEILPLLLAGERVHIGKNTSFGFGRYVVK